MRNGLLAAAPLALGLVASAGVATARDFSGRYILTYQDAKLAGTSEESFLQRYDASLRDRLFETTDVKLSFFFDDTRNMTNDRTLRRYRGELDLTHKLYTFNVRVSPRQKLTPLEQVEGAREVTDNQFSFDLHPQNAPRLRLFYARRSQYTEEDFAGRSRDFRGDLSYRYKIVYVALNRWMAKSGNGNTRETTVTGGTIRLTKSFGTALNVQTGYEHQITDTEERVALDQKVTNQTFTALLSGRHKNVFTTTLSVVSRRLTTEQLRTDRGYDDTISGLITLFPSYPVKLELGRNYLRNKREDIKRLSDYGTVQLIATSPAQERLSARVQVAKRFEIKRENGLIPSDLLYLSLRSKVYEGIESRADLSVSRRNDGDVRPDRRYQMTSVLDMFIKPRPNLQLNPSIQYINFDDHFTLLRNERYSYGVTINYFPRSRITIGTDLRRNRETTGRQQKDTSVLFNLGLNLRNRSNVNISYGFNQLEQGEQGVVEEGGLDTRATTLNIQTQFWLTRRGALSVNFSQVDREEADDTDYLAVSYRQHF